MTRKLSEEARRIAFVEADDLDAARTAVAKLTDAACRIFYVELETRLALQAAGTTTPTLQGDLPAAHAGVKSDDETSVTVLSAITPPLPFKEAKRLAVKAFEREYLALAMTAANNLVTHAAIAAGIERRNFRKMLQRHGLRPRGTRMTKAEPDAKYTDQILKILDENPQGLRTYEIAEKTKQTLSNAFGILKLLKRQERVERHGERYNTLWTLPGVTPVPRIETIPAAAVAVVSKAPGPIDAHCLRDQIRALLRDVGESPSTKALNRAIARLISDGTLACHGANEHGAMYVLAQEGDAAELN